MTKFKTSKVKSRKMPESKSDKPYKVVTVEQKHYEFKNLSKEAQEKAVENYRNKYSSTDADSFAEDFADEANHGLKEDGYDGLKVMFSLGHSQDDGVAFEGRVSADDIMDKNPEMKKKYKSFYGKGIYFAVKNSGNYTHYNSFSVENNEYMDSGKNFKLSDEFANDVRADLQERSKKLEKEGYDAIDEAYSDEYIKDNIQMNDRTFDENGKMW